MAYKGRKSHQKKLSGKIKKRFIFLLIVVPLFLLGASFFAFAAAQSSTSDRAVENWLENCDEIAEDYFDCCQQTNLAGIITFNNKNIIPFYSGLDSADDSAIIFGNILPGQCGRTVILGHNESDFAYLSQLNLGDQIIIESYEGEYIYIVSSVNVVVPSEIPLFETEEAVLTLVSQYPFRTLTQANRRYVVEAVLMP